MATEKIRLRMRMRDYTLPQAREAIEQFAEQAHATRVREGASDRRHHAWVFYVWGDNFRRDINNKARERELQQAQAAIEAAG